nr:uncharacterized protein LOC127482624 [Oryctolagus cuniculus]
MQQGVALAGPVSWGPQTSSLILCLGSLPAQWVPSQCLPRGEGGGMGQAGCSALSEGSLSPWNRQPPPTPCTLFRTFKPELCSPRSRRTAHSKSALRPPEKPEDAQAAVEGSTESPYSKQKSDKEVEPTVTFLFTLLNTPEPAEPTLPDPDLEIQEKRFLDQEDWGSQQTSREIRCLQDDCARLREALKTNQVDNLELKKKLQNLDPCLCLGPTPPRSPASGDVAGVSFPAWPCRPLLQPASLYESLKAGAKAIRAEVSAIRAEVRAAQEEALAVQEAMLSQMHTQQQQVGREGRLPGTARSSSLRLYLQPPSSRRAARLVLLPEVPLDHRGQGQPWPGPRPETGHLLGKALGQLNPP